MTRAPRGLAALATFLLPTMAATQEAPLPERFLAIELERSRACVDVIARVDALDAQLAPLAERSRRLMSLAEAIALEDDRIMGSLDATDAVESEVLAWFSSDQELAQRYVATLSPTLVGERATARAAIQAVVAEAVTAVQAAANERIATSGDLAAGAGNCDGAIFVRSAVEEACATATATGPLCLEVASPESTRFRFVASAEEVWQFEEMRPWSDPTPLYPSASGTLEGARSIGFARVGNIVVTVAFAPTIRDRAQVAPEEALRVQAVNDSLGIQFTHEGLSMNPSLSLRATLPQPLDDESAYVLRFGSLEPADVLWWGEPGDDAVLQAVVPLGATQVGRLVAGEPITFAAVRADEGAGPVEAFSVELTAVNQARSIQALLGYMTEQLGRDLATLVRPRGRP